MLGWGHDRPLPAARLPPGPALPQRRRARRCLWYRRPHPLGADGTLIIGRLGDDLSVADGVAAARLAALGLLASVQAELGSLDRVERFLHVLGVVHATPDFGDHTAVVDGASAVFTDTFGERGEHARLAVGVASLPAGIAVEVEATIAVRP